MADFLTSIAPQDHGDDSKTGGIAAALVVQIAAHDQHSPEEAVRFQAALAQQFQAQLNRWGKCEAWTDYGPDTVLCAAATEAGISLTSFRGHTRVGTEFPAKESGPSTPRGYPDRGVV
jgi:hypothetical protein